MACELHSTKQTLALFAEAQRDYGLGNYLKAIDVFEHLLASHSDIIDDWNLKEFLGLCNYYVEEYDKAASYLRDAWTILNNAPNLELHRVVICDNLGCTYYRKREYKNALDWFEKGKRYFGGYRGKEWAISRTLFYLTKGRCQFELDMLQDAYTTFHEASKEIIRRNTYSDASEDDTIIAFEIGRVQYHLNNRENALIHFNRVTPSLLDRYYRTLFRFYMFKLYLLLERYDAAMKEFTELESLGMQDIDKSEAYYILGILYFRKGMPLEARASFNKALTFPTSQDWIHKDCDEYIKDLNSTN